tara:strand:+ start:2193 stop:2759 length:567 start_codon:yes stop_codon:yes gene_type:complete
MSIENIYATPVYSKILENYGGVNNQIDEVINNIKFDEKDEWGRPNKITTPFFDQDNIQDYHLSLLANEIDKCIVDYTNQLNFYYDDYDRKSWILKLEKGDFAHSHNHSSSDLSGVYYYRTNSQDGSFFFESPNPYFEVSNCFKKLADRNFYKPEPGKILLFPGWLRHGIFKNDTDNERISISFNINFR